MQSILIVEYNPFFMKALKATLERLFPHICVMSAKNEQDLFHRMNHCLPDLIFMDIHLGTGKNGLELTKEIKAIYSHIPVVVISSYDLKEYHDRASENGAAGFLPKDMITPNKIVSLVKSILSLENRPRNSERPSSTASSS